MGKDEMWWICSWWRKCIVKTLQDGTQSASRGLCLASCQTSNKAFDEITTTLVSVSQKKRDCGQFNYHRTITISGSFIILKRCHSQKPFAWKKRKSLKHKRLSYCPNNRAILIQSDAITNYSKQKHPAPLFLTKGTEDVNFIQKY